MFLYIFRAIKQEELPTPVKKPKLEDEVDGKLSKDLKEQSELIFNYRDQLKTNLKRKDLQYLLEYNDQEIPAGDEQV